MANEIVVEDVANKSNSSIKIFKKLNKEVDTESKKIRNVINYKQFIRFKFKHKN